MKSPVKVGELIFVIYRVLRPNHVVHPWCSIPLKTEEAGLEQVKREMVVQIVEL
jgi:hypothetical protein